MRNRLFSVADTDSDIYAVSDSDIYANAYSDALVDVGAWLITFAVAKSLAVADRIAIAKCIAKSNHFA